MNIKVKAPNVAAAGARNNTNNFIQWFDDSTKIKPGDCPKYSHCSANICPLDPEWHIRNHLKDERVCFYLREIIKADGRAILRGVLPKEHYERIAETLPIIISCYAPLKKQLARAAKTGSRLNKPRRKNAA